MFCSFSVFKWISSMVKLLRTYTSSNASIHLSQINNTFILGPILGLMFFHSASSRTYFIMLFSLVAATLRADMAWHFILCTKYLISDFISLYILIFLTRCSWYCKKKVLCLFWIFKKYIVSHVKFLLTSGDSFVILDQSSSRDFLFYCDYFANYLERTA